MKIVFLSTRNVIFFSMLLLLGGYPFLGFAESQNLEKVFSDTNDPGVNNSAGADEGSIEHFSENDKQYIGKEISPPSGYYFRKEGDLWANFYPSPEDAQGHPLYNSDGSSSGSIRLRWGPSFDPGNAAVFPLRATGWLDRSGDEVKTHPTWKIALYDIKCDLDVDSNNNGKIEVDNLEEDKIEDRTAKRKPGCVLISNYEDVDEDGIIDYCDGFNYDGIKNNKDDYCSNGRISKMVLRILDPNGKIDYSKVRIRFRYIASNPEDIEIPGVDGNEKPYFNAPPGFRVWKKANRRNMKSIAEGGDFIPAGDDDSEGFTLDQLEMDDIDSHGKKVTLYVEAVPGMELCSKEDRMIKAEMLVEGDGNKKTIYPDSVLLAPVRLDVDVDSNNDGVISSDDIAEDAIEYLPYSNIYKGKYIQPLVKWDDPHNYAEVKVRFIGPVPNSTAYVHFDYSQAYYGKGNERRNFQGRLNLWTSNKVGDNGFDFATFREGGTYVQSYYLDNHAGKIYYYLPKIEKYCKNGILTLYAEVIKPEDKDVPTENSLTVSVYLNFKGSKVSMSDTVLFTDDPPVDLDVDSNNDGIIDENNKGEDEYEQYAPGVIVCKNRDGENMPDHLIPMKIRTLSKSKSTGTLILEVSKGADKVKIWENTSKTTEAKQYIIGTDSIPETVYVDGIKEGEAVIDLVYKNKSGIEASRDKVAVTVIDTISFSPAGGEYCSYVSTWEPVKYKPKHGKPRVPSKAIDMILDNLEHQGWQIVRYLDTHSDDKPENCTLANFESMATDGIVIVNTHGTSNPLVCAQYFTTKKAANNWVGNTPRDEMFVAESDGFPGYWFVATTKKWFENHWKTYRDQLKGITIFYTCHGAEGGAQSIVCSAGGRVKLGYAGKAYPGRVSDMKTLFKRLNGSQDNGNKRTVGKAYDNGNGYSPNFKMFGNGWTTLNPSPLLTAKTEIHDDKGSGLIVFDTFMESRIAPNSAVVFTNGTGSMRRWFGFSEHKFGISFDFSATPVAKAEAYTCVNEELGRKLSGDKKKYGSDKIW